MPVDPIGLAFGLAGLYTTSLEVLDRISTAKSYGEDYDLFVTKVEIDRLRLFRWGQAVGLALGGIPHENLQDPAVQRAVCELFRRAICFFEDSEVVKKRHAVETLSRGFISFVPERIGSLRMLGADRETSLVVATAVDHPRERAGRLQKGTSTLRKVKWAFSGKAKSEKLMQELAWFIDRLHALVPIPGPQLHQQPHHATNSPRVAEVSEVLPLAPPAVGIMHLTSSSGRNRMERRRLESSIRRTRMKHARRAAVGAVADAERKIRANERYSQEIPGIRQTWYTDVSQKTIGTPSSLLLVVCQAWGRKRLIGFFFFCSKDEP